MLKRDFNGNSVKKCLVKNAEKSNMLGNIERININYVIDVQI